MAGHPHTVLVVDDDAEIRSAVVGILRRAGYTVLEAGDGSEALAVANQSRPDLVLLDMNLPGKDGVQIAREFKGIPLLAPVPLVALSAGRHPSVRQRALEAGCAVYLTKPCPAVALRKVIAATLGEARASLDAGS
jgi:CheY-like chemotaxis protein